MVSYPVAVRAKPVSMRNLLVELPEDKLMKLVAKAADSGVTTRVYAANLLLKDIK